MEVEECEPFGHRGRSIAGDGVGAPRLGTHDAEPFRQGRSPLLQESHQPGQLNHARPVLSDRLGFSLIAVEFPGLGDAREFDKVHDHLSIRSDVPHRPVQAVRLEGGLEEALGRGDSVDEVCEEPSVPTEAVNEHLSRDHTTNASSEVAPSLRSLTSHLGRETFPA